MNRKKIKILGKFHRYSESKKREFFFISWSEPAADPSEGHLGYIGVVDASLFDSIKIGEEFEAIVNHNGSYHQFIKL